MTFLAGMSGTFFSFVFGKLYDSTGQIVCKGVVCYYDTFVICSIACGINIVANFALLMKRKKDIA